MKGRRGNPGQVGKLVSKSVDAYVLSIETINRLSINYRVETFSYLICNAWELLLKARILDETRERRSIYYPTKRGQPPRTLSLRDCLSREFPDEQHPVRRNVERIAELRDEAVHLFISIVPRGVLGLFQASVLNYHKLLGEWFALSLSDRVTPGMMALVYDFAPDEHDIGRLRRTLGAATADYLLKYQAELAKDSSALGGGGEFSVGIEYKVALTKKPSEADISLFTGASGEETRIVEVPKDPSKTHPHRQVDLVSQTNKALAGRHSINSYDVQCVDRVFKIKKRSEFFYQSAVRGSPGQYSDAYIEWLANQFEKDAELFKKAREKALASR